MKALITILAVTAILSVTPLAHADPMELGDSGWAATISNSVSTDIFVDPEGNEYFLLIEIIKTFSAPPQDGQFPPISIDFTQIADDANTVAYIILDDEIITNNTGVDWTDYHWSLEGPAAFVISASCDFSVNPFTNIDWTSKTGWDANHASALNIDGGTVSNGSTFSPGGAAGWLVIEVDLAETDSSFTLTQHPTPEPATMILMAAGLPLLLRRKQRQNAAKS